MKMLCHKKSCNVNIFLNGCAASSSATNVANKFIYWRNMAEVRGQANRLYSKACSTL